MSHKKVYDGAEGETPKPKMDKKKLLTIALVTVVIVVGAVIVDNFIRNPRCEDETDAMNVVIQKVLPSLDELGPDDGFGLEVLAQETINSAEYYPVVITRLLEADKEEVITTIYVRLSNSKPFTKDSTSGQLIPYGI